PMWREPTFEGSGFGLGFAVTLDTADGQLPGSPGSFTWSGAASTHFWIDPAEDLAVVFMTQYMSLAASTRLNIGRELRSIIYGALACLGPTGHRPPRHDRSLPHGALPCPCCMVANFPVTPNGRRLPILATPRREGSHAPN